MRGNAIFVAVLGVAIAFGLALVAGCSDDDDSGKGSGFSAYCTDACGNIYDCESELKSYFGEDEFEDYWGTSVSDCIDSCEEHMDEATDECRDCTDLSCSEMPACVDVHCIVD